MFTHSMDQTSLIIPETINKNELIAACISELSRYTGESCQETLYTLVAGMDEPKRCLTMKDVEERNYTYVTLFYDTADELVMRDFLVSSPYKNEADFLIDQYIRKEGWGTEEDRKHYPRNYICKARKLWNEGKYI